MLNKVILVGRLNWCCESRKSFQITIESREENLSVEIYTSKDVYNTLSDYCKVNDVIGVNGVVAKNEDNELIIKADKVSFLSASSNR